MEVIHRYKVAVLNVSSTSGRDRAHNHYSESNVYTKDLYHKNIVKRYFVIQIVYLAVEKNASHVSFWLLREVPPSRSCFTSCGLPTTSTLPFLSAFSFGYLRTQYNPCHRIARLPALYALRLNRNIDLSLTCRRSHSKFLLQMPLRKTWNFPR